MSKSHEAVPNDGPELLTVEQAYIDLRQEVADFIPDDSYDHGFTFHQWKQDLLTDPEGLKIFVDVHNAVARMEWEQQREVDHNMLDQWLTEGGADFSD